MKILVTSGEHYQIDSTGILWTPLANSSYQYWSSRYLDIFDEVYLLVRAKFCQKPPEGWTKASGDGIKPITIPDFFGPSWDFIKNYPKIRQIISNVLNEVEAIILILNCPVAAEVWRILPSNRPYAVEIVGDPDGEFAPGNFNHPLRPLLRWWLRFQLQKICRGAMAAAYVTKENFQKSYLCPNYSVSISNVFISPKIIVSKPRPPIILPQKLRLIFVGSLEQPRKGADHLIDAVAICIQDGLDLELVIVGDGKLRPVLERQVTRQGLQGTVHFRGQLANMDAVCQELDQADLFVLPSKSEGLPRAMVEAMVRGLPCIGSTVGC